MAGNNHQIETKEEKTRRLVLNELDCILSLDKNRNANMVNVLHLFHSYSKILETIPNPGFKNSLLTSEKCLNGHLGQVEKVYAFGISNLIKDNPASFLISPVITDGHVFSSLIRKTKEGLSVTLINASEDPGEYGAQKYGGGPHGRYEEYLIEEKNINKLLFAIKKTSFDAVLENPKNSLADAAIYNLFRDISYKKYDLNVVSRDQKVGNCIFKQPEKAIKYALATSHFTDKQFKLLRNFENRPFKPKWPTSAFEMHRSFVERLKDEYKPLAAELSRKFEKYKAYKSFGSEGFSVKPPVTGKSIRLKNSMVYVGNKQKNICMGTLQDKNTWVFTDAERNKIGYGKIENNKTDYFDMKNNFLGYSLKEPIGEKHFAHNHKMTGYARFFYGMEDEGGGTITEHKGCTLFERMARRSLQMKEPSKSSGNFQALMQGRSLNRSLDFSRGL